MKLCRYVSLGIGMLLLVGCHAPQLSKNLVILISIDACRPDYLQRGLTPNLAALAEHGVRAQWMIPSFPTVTYPNHYSLVTGLYPDHNGVIGNAMEDGDLRSTFTRREGIGISAWFDEATPIWTTVQQAGGRAAVMFWPGSEAPNHGMRPDDWYPYNIKMSAKKRVDFVLRWLAGRPNFVALYFDKVDYEGHHHGPDSKEVDDALGTVDAQIGRLVAKLKERGLYDTTDIIVVSDHGMAKVDHTIYLDDSFDTGNAHALMVGGTAGVNPNTGRTLDARRLLRHHEHMRCWQKQDIPKRFHYGKNARVPQVVCLAQRGWRITTRQREKAIGYAIRGEHGYDNADPTMRAIFIAEGPDFRRGYVAKPFPNVDVYPLLTHLLNVSPERNDGDFEGVGDLLSQ